MKITLKSIRNFKVPKGSMTVWWLGQASFIVKSHGGVIAAIDPYVTDICGKLGKMVNLDCRRKTPSPITPEELVGIDIYVLTHSHEDHLDPEGLPRYRKAGGKGPYLAPAETLEKMMNKFAVPQEEITMTWPNKCHTIGDLTFRATFAIPPLGDDMTHVGYIVSAKNGPSFYFTGDTAYNEVLGESVASHNPDVMFTVINGTFRNLTAYDAARLANQIKPKLVIPYHHDLFHAAQACPQTLDTNLFLFNMRDRYKELKIGQAFTFPAKSTRK